MFREDGFRYVHCFATSTARYHIQQKRETLNKGAEVLLEKEKIEGVELKALMDVT